jgi:crotonobetaine/carnitine-CoA ligase
LIEPEQVGRLAEVIGDLPALATIIRLETMEQAAPSGGALEDLGSAKVVDFADLMTGPATAIDEAEPADLAQILYTSGTTGRSKGNMFGHTAILNWGRQVAAGHGLTKDDVYLVVFPLYHAGAWLSCVVSTMWANGTVALGRSFSASRFLDHARGSGATVVFMVSVAGFLLAQPQSEADRNHRVKKLVTAPPPPDPIEFERRFGLRLVAGFGLTDYGASHSRGVAAPSDRVTSSGTLNPGWEAKCVDDLGRATPPGTPGEILLRCNIPGGAASGYYKMPEETLESRRDLWFHTGDIGYIDKDEYLYFVDRKKDAIRRRGENISSIELELILGVDARVGASAFFPVRAEMGEDDVAVAVVPRAGHELTEEEIVRYCEANMPRYAVPRYVRILASLPTTANGKVLKRNLRAETEADLPQIWDRESRLGSR